MAEVALDASALLALLNNEAGATLVAEALPGAATSAVNLSEVVGKLAEAGMPESANRDALTELALDIVSFDLEDAYEAGMLRPSTKDVALSLGDRACVSLAMRLGVTALTVDRAWQDLWGDKVVRVIR